MVQMVGKAGCVKSCFFYNEEGKKHNIFRRYFISKKRRKKYNEMTMERKFFWRKNELYIINNGGTWGHVAAGC